ncbi:alpha/beta hydrolase [Plantactinospora sonchi]|uniref:Alpha/beta hydrolase n=1 Tax=Plantactinospora sonchi TaxID=1544735 RepID=A0ABU7RTW5_9ACTN
MADLADQLADAELAALVAASRAVTGPTTRELGPAAVRQAQRRRVLAGPTGPEPAVVEQFDTPVGVPVRLYRPARRPRPLVVYAHGGMWTIGDLDSHDRVCRRLCLEADIAVLAVDFRRAPEHPWPAAVEDVVGVLRWAFAHAEELAVADDRIAVAGDSSGGNLAALACLRLHAEGGPQPTAQVLVYPNTDLTLSLPSVTEKATGWGISTDDIAWGAELWVPEPGRRADPAVSPLHAPELGGLPAALVVTAEHDPLRDEGEAYAARLAAAGVPVRHRREPGMVHGFLTLDAVSPAAARAGQRVFADIAELLDAPR